MPQDLEANARRDQKVRAALSEGKIHPISAAKFRVMLENDEAGTTTLIDSLASVDLGLETAAAVAAFSAATPPASSAQFADSQDHVVQNGCLLGSSDNPANQARFRATALRNQALAEEQAKIDAAEHAEAMRTARAMGLA